MSLLKYFSLLVLWATIAISQESFGKAEGQNLTAVTWEHAVNSKDKLNKTLFNDKINMIEADVMVGDIQGDPTQKGVPIMAHPPNTTSDLSLTDFLSKLDTFNQNSTATKGVKLDFKTFDAFDKSTSSLSKYKSAKYFIWLNADILKGPGGATVDPVDHTKFLNAAKQFDTFGLSLGWTTGVTSGNATAYTADQIKDMLALIGQFNVNGTRITFPVRAVYAAESVNEMKNLTGSVAGATLTIWSSDGDKVDIDHLRDLVKSVGVDKTFIDVPEGVLAKLRLDTLSGGSPMNTVVFPMYAALSLIVGLRHILYNYQY